VLLLAGCATSNQQRTKNEIVKEALTMQAQSNWMKPVKKEPNLRIVQIPSHGYLGAALAAAVGGAAITSSVRGILTDAKKNTAEGVLFITTNFMQDRVIVSNAMEGLDLDGVNFFLAATEEEGKTLEPVIRASGARYIFINKEK